MNSPHRRMVEAVNGASLRRYRGTNRLHRALLGPGTLQLDEDPRAPFHRGQHFIERGNERAPADREALELVEGESVDSATRELPTRSDGTRHLVVVNDEDTVAAPVHVELDAIGAKLEGGKKGGEGVLGALARRAPMRDQ